MRRLLRVAPLAALTLLAGCDCGGDTGPTDTGPVDTGVDSPVDTGPRIDGGGRCGNASLEGAEECDDGNTMPDDGCAPDCTLECGDGRVSGAELCDTGIAVGMTGACPTTCDDGDDCTSDSLDGADCDTSCSFGPITVPMDGDMCCPPGADPTTDDDCAMSCGDGVRSGTETCDTAIAAGSADACPTVCNDGMACTTDALDMGGTCQAACTTTPITMPMGGDGCCPLGATPATDGDCVPGCGNGVVDPGETCDTAITSGPGTCPTMCNDMMACTRDVVANAGTCTAACTFTPITMPASGDGCCPAGATIGTDSDCAARCGDLVVTPPETCDDGNMTSGDGCSATCAAESTPLTAFRFTDLDIVDPHLWATVLLCLDVTNRVAGMDGVNPLLQTSIQTDGDMPADGLLDLSVAQVFSPLNQAAGAMPTSYVSFPDCTAPMSSTACTLPAAADRTAPVPAMNRGAGVCLGALPGTTRYTITEPTAPTGGTCYSASAGTIMFSLGGIPIMLEDASIGGEYFGTPATEIRDGLIRGFMSYAQAMATIIPAGTTGIGSIDGQPLARLLRTRSTTGMLAGACGSSMSTSDLDVGPDGTTPGWYFYLRFVATRPVSYTEL